MLSKLLSNIRVGNNSPGSNALVGSGEQEGEMKSSERVFKSLLQSLQNESSSEKGKQPLLTLSGEGSDTEGSTEGKNTSGQILGGSFTLLNGDAKAENTQEAKQEILEELQNKFQDIKNELAGESSKKVPEEDQKKVRSEQKILDSEDASDATADEGQTLPQDGEASSESGKNVTSDTQVATQGTASEASEEDGKFVKKTSGNQSSQPEQIQGDKKSIQPQADNTDNNIVGDKPNNDESKDAASKNRVLQESAAGEGEQAESSQTDKHSVQGVSKSLADESSQSNLLQEVEGGKAVEGNVNSTKEQSSPKMETEQPQRTVDAKRIPVEKGELKERSSVSAETVKKPKTDQPVKSKPITPESLSATKQSQGGQTAKTELSEQQKKVTGSFVNNRSMSNISAKGLEMKNPQAENDQKDAKSKNELENKQRRFGSESSEERNKLLKRLGISGVQAQKQAKPLGMQGLGNISVGDSNMNLKEQMVNWEKQVTQTIESGNEQESKSSSGIGSARLGQMPIANVSLRKKILPGLTQRIQQATSSAKQDTGNWQKHSFTLDDGKNIQLSVRESKGMLQVKMGSMNLDLSKLLQQNLQQIREHLRQEFDTEIDLQFENQQQGEESQFSGDTESSDRKRNYRTNVAAESLAAETVEEVSTKTVRNFGYNQMEWTA